ncbi:cupin domain-containing protein [Paroceanicella profunda]|uniref:Cupin domain-containing protein n=1 Tax=Paroceanicella profunda TaxID=2579971 RepID=A0A5B8FZ36_9RHOB|nr:cupin domain-containing protein [Paroceanicella profunda]QDL91483.1 cupin domain-containing protein [Paroceanicella profunda]
MTPMPAGITGPDEAFDQTVWNILGQTYTLKQVSEDSMSWHAHFPDGTFVPPHIHFTQEEFVYVLTGTLTFWLDGTEFQAGPGSLARLPRNVPHGIFNRSGADVTCLFWVTPTRGLLDAFKLMHNQSEPAEVVRIASQYELEFLPPPAA